jgi:hypothetical protein
VTLALQAIKQEFVLMTYGVFGIHPHVRRRNVVPGVLSPDQNRIGAFVVKVEIATPQAPGANGILEVMMCSAKLKKLL